DVVLHAVIDALLGAAGLGDIGRKFPDTDPAYKDVSSEILLARVMEEIRPRWGVVNADVTIVAEAPRLAPHAGAIAERVGQALGTDRVSIKAKTNEGLGPVGAGEAIECLAVVELAPRGSP
ncbi:MAG: 2-C-methyl-D-erythritol 2,4-cyclodiphosphate synthase, partial [Planctomycetota bacterium]